MNRINTIKWLRVDAPNFVYQYLAFLIQVQNYTYEDLVKAGYKRYLVEKTYQI